ncbi:MAG: MFS transporter [Campylobacterota bacterium]|nr:MFS transporter [Campylobacterota bacterium]
MNTKKSIYAWAFYDWANSAYATTVMAGFFPLFFKSYFSADADVTMSTAQLGFANALSSLIVVLIAPLLGAIADVGSIKKRFLFLFAYLGILMSASLAFVGKGEWEMAIFVYVLGNIGFMGSNSFYDALLPSVAGKRQFDHVSGLGFALGYLGGGILFALNVAMVQFPDFFSLSGKIEAVKVSFISVALWWALFSLPLLFFVKESRSADKIGTLQTALLGYRRLIGTLKKIRSLKGLLLFLVAYWLYIDGVDTIIRMAVDYGMAIGFDPGSLITALLIVQFVGFPATLFFAYLAQRWDTKKALYLAISIYLIITFWATVMDQIYEFYLLALLIALVQGGIQALSRSYYARMIPEGYAAEFFGFYNFLGKFAAILGPALVGIVALMTGDSRAGIASVAIFFVLGGLLLMRVDEKKVAEEVRSALT